MIASSFFRFTLPANADRPAAAGAIRFFHPRCSRKARGSGFLTNSRSFIFVYDAKHQGSIALCAGAIYWLWALNPCQLITCIFFFIHFSASSLHRIIASSFLRTIVLSLFQKLMLYRLPQRLLQEVAIV
jgi:hypothetical protein